MTEELHNSQRLIYARGYITRNYTYDTYLEMVRDAFVETYDNTYSRYFATLAKNTSFHVDHVQDE